MPSRVDLAKIHIAAKELGIFDDDYRMVLWERYKKSSAKDLTPRQAWDLLSHFKQKGWRPRSSTGRSKKKDVAQAQDPQSRMIRALWIELKKIGVLRDSTERALASFVKRMTGIDRLEWCDPLDKNRVIEALKGWVERERP